MPNKPYLYRIQDLGEVVVFNWTAEVEELSKDDLIEALQDRIENRTLLATENTKIQPYEIKFIEEAVRNLKRGFPRLGQTSYQKPDNKN